MTKEKKERRRALSVIFALALSLAFLLFLLRSDIAIDYMKISLKLCGETVIPSLFPFMVISSLMVSSGVGVKLCRPLVFPSRLMLGISDGGACATLLGAVCGLPVGANVLCKMYDRGMISKKELERVLAISNNPGSAFVISAVGISLFGSVKIGIMLYLSVILSAFAVGIISRFFVGKCEKEFVDTRIVLAVENRSDYAGMFTSAVRDSALSMLSVCAMIAFFSSFLGCVGATLVRLGVSETPIALISSFFEVSGGVSALCRLQGNIGVVLSAAALGWSGFCVHFQVMSLCSGRGISFKRYFLSKIAQSFLSAALSAIFLRIVPLSHDAFADSLYPLLHKEIFPNTALFWCVISAAVALSGAICFIGKRGKIKKQKYSKNFAKRG